MLLKPGVGVGVVVVHGNPYTLGALLATCKLMNVSNNIEKNNIITDIHKFISNL